MKLRKISDIHPTLAFTEYDFIQKYSDSFKNSELGRIHDQLPLKEIGAWFKKQLPRKNPQGNKPMFPIEGEIALMFLKAYTGVSDDLLVEMINGSYYMQMFCGVLIDPAHPIKDGKIVSAIRNRLARVMKIDDLQRILYQKWKDDLKDKEVCMTDATCYESHLRYPTDIKLLWECCEWLNALIIKTCKTLKERCPRNKYADIAKARLAYAKQRKPRKSATRTLQRRLLSLLNKLIGQWNQLRRQFSTQIHLCLEQEKRLMAIDAVYKQQLDHYNGKDVKHRIVSVDRPYLRPIVRGKENKRVEFGAKVNNIQIDGISFIEHHSFEAFNEGVRLKQSVAYQENLTGITVTKIGADSIYANNENRTWCTERHIITSFAPKGPKSTDKPTATVRRIMGNIRATVMEGSFGNQKQHYGVGRISARNRFSETLLLFFGIHMANAATMAERKLRAHEKDRARERERKRA